MQERGIISTNQFIWMLFIIITTVAATQAPQMLIAHAGRDVWLSVIGGWFLDVLLALVYAYMGIRFPGQNFVQYSMSILGKYAGRLVGIAFPLFFLLACILLQSAIAHIINSVLLIRTPFELILALSFILSAYAARKGIEIIARVSQIFGPIYILGIVLIGLMSFATAEIDRLKPQLEQGVYHFLTGSPFMLTFFGICIMMAMFIPLCNRPENGFLAKFTAVSMGAFFVGTVVVVAIAVFGLEHAQRINAPFFIITKTTNLRVEAVWLLITVSAVIMASAMMIWAFSLGLSQIAGLSAYKPLVFPAALLAFIISITSFNKVAVLMHYINFTYTVIAVFVEAGLEILLFILALFLKKRG